MLIDTSAIIAILAPEPDAARFVRALEEAPTRFVGAHVRLEATINLARILGLEIPVADRMYEDFLDAAGIAVLPVTDAISRIAVDAYSRFGKGRGHTAQLNFADCLSYACAASIQEPILFKGNDFRATDLSAALG